MSINRQMAKNAVWTVGLRMFDRGVGVMSTLILVRLLMPEDFGLVAMATVFFHLLSAVSDFSVHVPLIQRAEIDRQDMDSAWTLQCLVGFGQAVILVAVAHPVSVFYQEPRLVSVMYVLALTAAITGIANIGVVMFQREMAFDREFVLKATQRLVGLVVTVAAAWVWKSYWALLVGMLSNSMVGAILSYGMHPYRPRVSVSKARELIHFSKWMLLNNLFTFLGTRAPDFLLGRLYGARSVGLYSVSYEVAMLPTTELVAPINRVALPGYSRMRDTEGGLQHGFLDVIGLIALIALPAAMGIAATADVVVPILLGDKWRDAIPVIHYLAIGGALGALITNSWSVMLALGRPALLTVQQFGRMVLLLPAIYFGAVWAEVEGIAIAYLIVTAVMLSVNVAITLGVLALSFWAYLQVVYRPLVGVIVMYPLVRMVFLPWLSDTWGEWEIVVALCAVGLGAAVFVVCELLLWVLAGRPTGAETRFLELMSQASGNRLPWLSAWVRKQKESA
ncbi:lipopolysaccharide biosynthesis protein [Lentisalinibacter orientalis]|uniref:lipopolysaccharide biosynthesis protein n=1 Tax=Lentisalinibacter orientalis TaxID=2992241 RepID=UPI00386F5B8F